MITIISPVFQAERFIETCIENVAQQAYPELQHLIIDGGSTDETVSIIRKKAVQYPHIQWISEKDTGQSNAMNKGIQLARNPVISFLNADDFYAEGAISFARQYFEKATPNNFLVGNCRVLKEDGSEYMINKPHPFDPVSFQLDFNFPFNPSAYFYHKSLHEKVGYYDENDHLTMDIDFIFKIMNIAHIHYEDKILGNYVMVATSKTMVEISSGRNLKNLELVFEKYKHKLSVNQRINLKFQQLLGQNRGWVMYYIRHPEALVKKLFGKSASH